MFDCRNPRNVCQQWEICTRPLNSLDSTVSQPVAGISVLLAAKIFAGRDDFADRPCVRLVAAKATSAVKAKQPGRSTPRLYKESGGSR